MESEKVWHCHHRLEDEGHTREELKKRGLVFNRPPEELIFLPPHTHLSDHATTRLLGHEVSVETRNKIGNANRGKKRSEEVCRAISERKKGVNNHNFGKHFSEEHRRKIGDAQRGEKGNNWGKHPSEETIRKMVEHRRGIKWTDEARNNHQKQIEEQKVCVEQYTIDGTFVATYSSIHEAAEAVNGSAGHICCCCKGKRKQHKNYIWKYAA